MLEGAPLQVPDIDSDRMLLHIHGKGQKDRYGPLPEPTLENQSPIVAREQLLLWNLASCVASENHEALDVEHV